MFGAGGNANRHRRSLVGGELFPISRFNAERAEEQSHAERSGAQGNEDVGDVVLGEENRRTSSQSVIGALRYSAPPRSRRFPSPGFPLWPRIRGMIFGYRRMRFQAWRHSCRRCMTPDPADRGKFCAARCLDQNSMVFPTWCSAGRLKLSDATTENVAGSASFAARVSVG